MNKKDKEEFTVVGSNDPLPDRIDKKYICDNCGCPVYCRDKESHEQIKKGAKVICMKCFFTGRPPGVVS